MQPSDSLKPSAFRSPGSLVTISTPLTSTAAGLRYCPSPTTNPAGSRYGLGALKRIAQEVAGAQIHTRNTTLNRGAFAAGQLAAAGHLDPCGAAEVLHAAAVAAGLTKSETVRTNHSGMLAGGRKPRGGAK